jgi:hypothetical protein
VGINGFTLRKELRLFVEAGTNPTVRDNDQKTARDYELQKTEPREKAVLFLRDAEENWARLHPDNTATTSECVIN